MIANRVRLHNYSTETARWFRYLLASSGIAAAMQFFSGPMAAAPWIALAIACFLHVAGFSFLLGREQLRLILRGVALHARL